MTEAQSCPKCGAVLPTDAPAGICPRCLLGAGLPDRAGAGEAPRSDGLAATTPPGGEFVPPKPEELASHFPQLEIQNVLGYGGMGAVYRARQKKLDRLVALKIIRPESANDPSFAERFNREARTLARLSHANIVAIYDFGEVSLATESGDGSAGRSLYYFLMEYVDGANLRQLLHGGELPPERALHIVPQICEALQFAHDEGIVHRDIKPENILVDMKGRVKIADFGLAKLVSDGVSDQSLTATHQVMGTPRYMAPEQMEGARAVDHRADIYSLGVVFYEMLTGELPLGRFDPPSRKARIDTEWDQVVLRALEKDPQRRYQHASEVKSEVERISGLDRPPVQVPPGAGREGSAAAGDHRTVPDYGALLMGGVMVTLGLLLLFVGLPGGVGSPFLWIGIGIALGGGGCFSGAFADGSRLPGGTRADMGMLMQGAVMLGVGACFLGYSFIRNDGYWSFHVANVFVWVGIGLVLGGGGCFAGAWKKHVPDAEMAAALAPRFSRKAIIGACWAPFFFLAVLLFFITTERSSPAVVEREIIWVNDHSEPSPAIAGRAEVQHVTRSVASPTWRWLLIAAVLPLGLTAPLGTTVLGLMSIRNIRQSAGRLTGMPLAVADALFYPLLLLDALIVASCVVLILAVATFAETAGGRGLDLLAVAASAGLLALPVCALLDFLLARAAWRKAVHGLKWIHD